MNSPSCTKFQQSIALLAADCLDPSSHSEVLTHLESCSICQKRHEAYRQITVAFKEVVTAEQRSVLPLGFQTRLFLTLKQRVKRPPSMMTLAAAAVAVFLVGPLLYLQRVETVSAPSPNPYQSHDSGVDFDADMAPTYSNYSKVELRSPESFEKLLTLQAKNILQPDPSVSLSVRQILLNLNTNEN